MGWIADARNWLAQRMAVTLDTSAHQYLVDAGAYYAGTSGSPSVYQTAAVEFAAGIIGRAAMAAEVQVSGVRLDPHAMGQLFRQTVLLGESVQVIDLDRRSGDVLLLPVALRPVITGGPSPSSWRYEVKLPRPNGENPIDADDLPSRNVPAEGIVHVRYMPRAYAPWVGVSPLEAAGFTAETLARIEKSLQDDAKVPTGSILPQPDGVSATGIAQAKAAVSQGKGALTLVETTAGGFGLGPSAAPRQDWQQSRFGAMPPAANIQLWESAMLAVMAALGVPPSLYTSQGAALRETYRQLFSSCLVPLARLVEGELSEKLETPVSIRFPERLVSDISALSRGFKGLTEAGYLIEQVHQMLGFPGDAPEEPEPEPMPTPPAESGADAPTPPTPATNGNGRAHMVFS